VGHIATLCEIARPDVSVVLNVGSAHLGEFGSQESIAQAKAEIVRGLTPGGTAVLNADDGHVLAMAGLAGKAVLFGADPRADVRVSQMSLDSLARPEFQLRSGSESVAVRLSLTGSHMASNAAAAAAVALHFGMSLTRVAELLAQATPRSRWRMEVSLTPSGVTLVNDSYNANPESMRAALQALVAMRGSGRTFAVLGEMLELGDSSREEHDAIGRLAVRLDIDQTIAVGEGARTLFLGASQEGSWDGEAAWVADARAAVDLLRPRLRPGDVVLVKASRSIGLEAVAEALMEESG
jgi:UDP-N-acetylmuramoyl-tripeptide--D-alanyl-D-alanine ligase